MTIPKNALQEMARKGGIAAHEAGTAHEWTPEEARAAGAQGGRVTSAIPGHMSRIGKLGGDARAAKRRQREGAEREDGKSNAREEP